MIAQVQIIGALEAFAIILSVVSLIISVVTFFASLKFYRDGVQLQQAANDALTKISEKTEFIQTQVGGMFDKTLDAAIGKREILSVQFEELNEQLEKTKAKLIEESIGQIGAAGEQERKRLSTIVDNQIALIREKVETTRESAQEMVDQEFTAVAPLTLAILAVTWKNPKGLTSQEIRQRLSRLRDEPSLSTMSRRLKDLMNTGQIILKDGRYFANKEWTRGQSSI